MPTLTCHGDDLTAYHWHTILDSKLGLEQAHKIEPLYYIGSIRASETRHPMPERPL